MSDALCCIIPLVLLLLVPFPILWARKKWSMRGMKSRFEMDAAVCLEPAEGDVIVRRKKVRNVILLVVVGLAGIGVLALAPSILRDLRSDETMLWEAMDQILMFVIGLIVLWGGAFVLARSIFSPALTFDRQNGVLVMGRGKSERRIPFSDLAMVAVKPLALRFGGGFEVNLVQHDGEEIEIGTVSGSKMKQRAEGIAHLIERVTGAPAQFTYLEAGEGDFIVSPEDDGAG